MMEHEMKESLPKSWDKTKRVYEILYRNGKKEIWKNITARECLTRYENMDPFGNGLKIREIEGKELQLLKVMDSEKNRLAYRQDQFLLNYYKNYYWL